jgi:hypothetical protein
MAYSSSLAPLARLPYSITWSARPSSVIGKGTNSPVDHCTGGHGMRFHLIEGETVTPLLLAKRFTLNPVLVIISLVFWFWMWGISGVILSMPMLAITKIICDRLQPLAPFGHFLEG